MISRARSFVERKRVAPARRGPDRPASWPTRSHVSLVVPERRRIRHTILSASGNGRAGMPPASTAAASRRSESARSASDRGYGRELGATANVAALRGPHPRPGGEAETLTASLCRARRRAVTRPSYSAVAGEIERSARVGRRPEPYDPSGVAAKPASVCAGDIHRATLQTGWAPRPVRTTKADIARERKVRADVRRDLTAWIAATSWPPIISVAMVLPLARRAGKLERGASDAAQKLMLGSCLTAAGFARCPGGGGRAREHSSKHWCRADAAGTMFRITAKGRRRLVGAAGRGPGRAADGRVASAIRRDPSASDRQVSRETGASRWIVARCRIALAGLRPMVNDSHGSQRRAAAR